MWKTLQPPYYITFDEEANEKYSIGVTNFRRYWLINTSKKSFLADLKESNDGLEFDDENELLQRGLEMVCKPEDLLKVTIIERQKEQLLFVTLNKKYEFALRIEMKLIEASTDHFFAAVIQPLLKTVCDLRSSQHELREALLKKDKEITEYKLEGKAPKHLKTTVYDDTAHLNKHSVYEEYFNALKLPQLLEDVAFCSSSKRKRSPSPKAEETLIQIKKSTQENGTSSILVQEQIQKQEETKVSYSGEVKTQTPRSKQRKKLTY